MDLIMRSLLFFVSTLQYIRRFYDDDGKHLELSVFDIESIF